MTNPRAYHLWGLIAGLVVGALLAPFIWIVNLFHPSAAAQVIGESPVTLETLLVIAILFVVLALVYALVRSNFQLATQVPAPLVQEIVRTAVDAALNAAQRYVETTTTKADDELLALIRTEVGKIIGGQIQTLPKVDLPAEG